MLIPLLPMLDRRPNGIGKLVMETVLGTKASNILQFIHGLRGELHVTWEEGTWGAWLYDLLPQVQADIFAGETIVRVVRSRCR